MNEGSFIDFLHEARSEAAMDFDGRPNRLVSQPFILCRNRSERPHGVLLCLLCNLLVPLVSFVVAMNPIYLDYNATTPIDPAVVEAMSHYLHPATGTGQLGLFGNPSSTHPYGRL